MSKVITTVNMLKTTKEEAQAVAKEQGVTLSWLVGALLKKEIKRHKREQSRLPRLIEDN